MKAVIMAGGEGTRLRPLTSLVPKPMVPIVNQPVMEHILGLVKHHEINEVVATLAFMPHVIMDYFGDGEEWGMDIRYAIEETPLGTAGSVKNAQSLLDPDEPFIVISGDALTDIDLGQVIAFHKERGAAVTIALKRVDNPLDFGVVITDENGCIQRFLEKPTWGQVFSDTINTGIYVMEPWVLDEIPTGEAYDFSGELFPWLMEQGHLLCGIVVDGYWCDVGSLETYQSVHRDVLDGKAMVYVPGVHAREGVWVSESASVDPTATLGCNVVIGENVTIRAGAVVGDYTVLGDNCVVGNDARISYSVAWDDTFVGSGASVAGAVLCRKVDVRARAVIDIGAVIGDETIVGHGAHVGADVQVYPYKRIEPAALVNHSLIWESTASRTLFTEGSISGLVGIDITPELGLKVAEAFGSLLPKGGHVVVSRDTSRAARMIKRAMISGLNAAGINVRDLRVMSPAVCRFTTQKTRCVGGIHLAVCDDDRQSLTIRLLDKNGLDIGPWEQKRIERLYFRGEFRRTFFNEIGEIIYPPRPLEYYTAALDEAIEQADLGDEWGKVVADTAHGTASLLLPLVGSKWRLNVVMLNPVIDSESGDGPSSNLEAEALLVLRHGVELFGADFGMVFDGGAERVRFLSPQGTLVGGDDTLHLMIELWCRTRKGARGDIAVPLTASLAVEAIASKYGCGVIRPGRSRRALAQAVLEGRAAFAGSLTGGFIFGDFFPAYDGVLTMGMAGRMLKASGVTMDDLLETLPSFCKQEFEVPCPSDRKGAVMRAVSDASAGEDVDLTDGIRVRYADGWALVLPDSSHPVVHVWAEASSDSAALDRAGAWRRCVEKAVAAG